MESRTEEAYSQIAEANFPIQVLEVELRASEAGYEKL